jgi:tRNA 2-selenouridine synthase
MEKPVWLESESRKIGQIQIPEALIEKMRGATHHHLELGADLRTQYLLKHYQHWIDQPQALEKQLFRLKPFMANETFSLLLQCLSDGRMEAFVCHLLEKYYDPLYDRSIAKNYRTNKQPIALDSLDHATLETLARSLVRSVSNELPSGSD